jgi:hypothetical protein
MKQAVLQAAACLTRGAAWLCLGMMVISLVACGGGGNAPASDAGGSGGAGGGAGGGGTGTSPLPQMPVVYVADQDVFERYELYLADAAGEGAPIKVNAPLTANGDVSDYALSADGTKVVYLADQEVATRTSCTSWISSSPAWR